MKFGIFYEHQLPRPWTQDSEYNLVQEALDQVELADKLGFDCAWEVEHHFLEEYSHSSAPEVFLAACSQRTKNIRLGHGINLTAPKYNQPARVAERVAMLDLVSNGRVEWRSGESGSLMEMAGFGIEPAQKGAMWREATEQIANMMTMSPYPGFQGEHFSMPARNVLPKPRQTPHPPMWLACSRRDSILRAARNGMGALVFGFVTPEQAAIWVKEYYDIIKSDECVPLGHAVNANFACLAGMSVHPDREEAMRRGIDGFRFFGYSLAHYAIFGVHKPGVTNVWDAYEAVRDQMPPTPGESCIGTPDEVLANLKPYGEAGVDQMIFIQQCGKNRSEHICESMERFATEVMPWFKEREAAREARKAAELAPYFAAALARKKRMPPLAAEDTQDVISLGRKLQMESGLDYSNAGGVYSDKTRGGSIPVPMVDPAMMKAKA
jgi:alkanesulfonate monooxygenase SsuD/methylene tetrahydromethanopterin reductase-like flavin-dependent oxidoreductase (luciferase family)